MCPSCSNRGERRDQNGLAHRQPWLAPHRIVRTVAILIAATVLVAATMAAAQHNHGAGPGRAPPTTAPAPRAEHPPDQPVRVIQIAVADQGFQPAYITVKKGERIQLVIVRRSDATCAREIVLDEFLVWRRLPLNEPVSETFTTGRVGEFPYRCPSGKVTGVLRVEE